MEGVVCGLEWGLTSRKAEEDESSRVHDKRSEGLLTTIMHKDDSSKGQSITLHTSTGIIPLRAQTKSLIDFKLSLKALCTSHVLLRRSSDNQYIRLCII